MINRLKIINFKSFKEQEIIFKDFNLIIGKNDAGKTNLVKALDFLAASVRAGNLNHANHHLGMTAIDRVTNILTGSNIFSFEIETEVRNEIFKYKIEISEDEDLPNKLSVVSELLTDNNEKIVFHRKENNIYNLEGKNVPLNVEGKDLVISLYKEERSHLVKSKISQIFLTDNIDFEERDFTSTNPKHFSSLLSKIHEKKGDEYRDFETIAKKIIPGFKGFTPILPSGSSNQKDQILFLLQKAESDKFFTTYSSSTGDMKTLYILAALFAKSQNSTLIIEEIENGLHPQRMKVLLEYIQNIANKRDVQLIITTHSPNIIDVTSPSKIMFVSRNNGSSEVTPVESKMTAEISDLLNKGGELSDYLSLLVK